MNITINKNKLKKIQRERQREEEGLKANFN
jgi:hypothetical protein